jgi:uncharacterized cupredoxin-like copper-binding protein
MEMNGLNKNMRMAVLLAAVLVVAGILLGACGRTAANGSTSSRQPGSADTAATTVNVVTDEMSITFETMPTRAGSYTFVVMNRGELQHDFMLEGNGTNYQTRKIVPQSSQVLTVELVPGTYKFMCSVPGHALVGMRGSFTVS